MLISDWGAARRGPGKVAPEYERTFLRARELASKIGESRELPRVLVGLAGAYYLKGDVVTAAEVAQEALAAAERTGETVDLLAAHRQLGQPLFFLGHFSRALQRLKHSIKLYNPGEHGSLAYTAGFDRRVSAQGLAAECHLYLGHPDRALAVSDASVTLAKRLEHPLTLALALSMPELSIPSAASSTACGNTPENFWRSPSSSGFRCTWERAGSF